MGAKGIAIRNDTGSRVFIGISLGAYMYWDAVEPGQWFIRNTGKVWMTVSAKVLPPARDCGALHAMPTTAGQVLAMFAAPVTGTIDGFDSAITNAFGEGAGSTLHL